MTSKLLEMVGTFLAMIGNFLAMVMEIMAMLAEANLWNSLNLVIFLSCQNDYVRGKANIIPLARNSRSYI